MCAQRRKQLNSVGGSAVPYGQVHANIEDDEQVSDRLRAPKRCDKEVNQ